MQATFALKMDADQPHVDTTQYSYYRKGGQKQDINYRRKTLTQHLQNAI